LPFLNSADIYSAWRLRTLLKEKSFDIVHAHVARDYTVAAAAAWRIPTVKLVLTRHLLYPLRPHRLYRRVDGWIATTQGVLETLEPLAPLMSAVIPNWVDLGKLQFRPHPLHDVITIGLLGQISPHKGHDDALEAMRLLGSRYRLLIAGTGEAAYVRSLKTKALGMPVDFLGFVSQPEFFEMTDILAVPSWEEPFGIVVLEAMAAGIPVVSTNAGGPSEIISNGVHGLLVPPRDPAALAQALQRVAHDEKLRSSIIKNARHHTEVNYEISPVVSRIEDFYRRMTMRF
jgi:glycosyltransferase involved in cell wall biosynthesis